MMAKRRPDPRVVQSATPALCRLKRTTSANADMNLKHKLEKCGHEHTVDGIVHKCDSAPLVTYTRSGLGTIQRYCLEHLVQKNERAATQEEMDMILRWAQARMQ